MEMTQMYFYGRAEIEAVWAMERYHFSEEPSEWLTDVVNKFSAPSSSKRNGSAVLSIFQVES